MSENRLFAPDALKGIMIILMVFGHLPRVGTFQDALNYLVDFIYLFHMPIFLFLSGYFFSININYIKVSAKKILSILYPYILFITLYLVLLYFLNLYGVKTSNSISDISVNNIFQKIVFNPIGAYWFLHTLIFYQIVLLITKLLFKNIDFWIEVVMIFITSFMLISVFPIEVSIKNLGFLILGYIFRKQNNMPSNFYLIIVSIIILILYSFNEIRENYIIHFIFIITLISFLNRLVIYKKESKIMKYLIYVGRNTLIILLVHAYFVNILKIAVPYILKVEATGVTYSIVSTFIVIHLSLFSAYLSDKFKISKYLFLKDEIYIKNKEKR
ncbi:acyltransferase family protein [Arcobacter arenosus]|uniref:acyltransferase family protein n=1 Tax=Arcobacter arenosus TaxID=2576037 RepID=UPI003BAD5F87